MNLLAKLRAMSAAGTATPKTWSSYRDGPSASADFRRILALPRRELTATEALADEWTERLKRPGGSMRLRPIQALALQEALAAGGLLGLIGVGWGKTLISLLLPTVWGARNSVLLVPPQLKTKLLSFEYPELSQHWQIPNIVGHNTQYPNTKSVMHVISYSDLSSAKRADVLERIRPDAIVCDEGHALRHASAARTKRFKRFFRAHTKPRTTSDDVGRPGTGVFLGILSGTLTSGSINDYAHLAALSLGDGSPLPLDWNTQQEWSYALDAGDLPSPPGVLEQFCARGEPVRSGFRRRLLETPGVVATAENDPGMSLLFNRRDLKPPKEVLEALAKMRAEWVRPDGMQLREAIEVYAASRQLSCGFYYRTIFPRNEPLALRKEWLEARRAYFSEVRERLNHSIPGQDSFLLLWNAAASGKWKSEHWKAWSEVRAAVEPDTETVWVSRFLVEAAVKWALEKPGIVWVESEAMKAAMAIAEGAGIPVYSSQEDAEAFYREDGSRSVVAGINAFKQGANLQAFNRNLITTCPASGALLEQTIGRTHRHGQKADEVTVDLYLHTPELVSALSEAKKKATAIQETTGNFQKLCVGTWLF